jgi:hypothetical protein
MHDGMLSGAKQYFFNYMVVQSCYFMEIAEFQLRNLFYRVHSHKTASQVVYGYVCWRIFIRDVESGEIIVIILASTNALVIMYRPY